MVLESRIEGLEGWEPRSTQGTQRGVVRFGAVIPSDEGVEGSVRSSCRS